MQSTSPKLLWIDCEHALYESERDLRTEVLRKPLGFERVERFEGEDVSLHLLLVSDDRPEDRPENRVIGCVLFRPDGTSGRLYQMAVASEYRGQGLGRKLVEALERKVIEKGHRSIFLHARRPVVEFYQKLGYEAVGEPFIEIGIEHIEMQKSLPDST